MTTTPSPRLSWNRDETGTITIYATWPDGRMAAVADLWVKPMVDIGMTRAEAMAFQERLAEQICERPTA